MKVIDQYYQKLNSSTINCYSKIYKLNLMIYVLSIIQNEKRKEQKNKQNENSI